MAEPAAITELNQDYETLSGPFNGATLPEKEALSTIPEEDHLNVLAAGIQLDYNRGAEQLWSNISELYHKHNPAFFDPLTVTENCNPDQLSEVFDDIGFRYCNRDAKGWYDNCEILVENFGGEWSNLIESADGDAMALYDLIDEHSFMYLSGDKLRPFFVKVVDMNIKDLEGVWELPIPVDIHVRRLTQDITGEDLSDDEVRAFWKEYGQNHDVNPMVVDTALWLVGNNWDEWGETYWENLGTE